MNIAIQLLNQGRGSGEVARQHTRFLIERGHKVFFVHPRVGEGVRGADNREVHLHTAVMPVHEYLPAAKQNQKAVSRMGRDEALAYLPDYEEALAPVAHETDIFFGHHANLSAVATSRVAKEEGKPYVLFLHGTGIEPRLAGHYHDDVWALIEEAIRGAAGILVTTDYVRDELVRPLIDRPVEDFLVLPCGVDLVEFHPENTAGIRERYDLPETFTICPGALTAVKGPQNVVLASETYADLAPTIFIGDGEMRGELEKKLGDRGRFLGFVPDQDKSRLINAATVLVAAPEKKEHFGIIYAEALAGGAVPVAYEGGGVGSVVTPEVGRLTDRNPASLGAAVREVLTMDEAERREMRRLGRARAESQYDYAKLVAELERWLEERLRSSREA
jgi:glycosyltransferase involved in cell wall biosynthesis